MSMQSPLLCGNETNTGDGLVVSCQLVAAHKGHHEAMENGSNYRWPGLMPRHDTKCPSVFGTPNWLAPCQKMAFHEGPHKGATDDLSFAHEWANDAEPKPAADMVNYPPHYTEHPSGVECITITEHMNYCLGNALKYLWRVDAKGSAVEDLRKAVWFINREIARREGGIVS